MQSVVMLSVFYAECLLCSVVMLSVLRLNVVMLSVVAPPFEANKHVFVNKTGVNVVKLFWCNLHHHRHILTEVMAIVV
jgi:hypothetical protein